MPEASDHVVEADIHRHEYRRGVLAQERHGEAELRREAVAPVSALEHGQGGLAGTAVLDQLEIGPARTLHGQEVVRVPVIGGRAAGDGRSGLKAHGIGSAEGEVVVRSNLCSLRRGREAQCAGERARDPYTWRRRAPPEVGAPSRPSPSASRPIPSLIQAFVRTVDAARLNMGAPRELFRGFRAQDHRGGVSRRGPGLGHTGWHGSPVHLHHARSQAVLPP